MEVKYLLQGIVAVLSIIMGILVLKVLRRFFWWFINLFRPSHRVAIPISEAERLRRRKRANYLWGESLRRLREQ